MAHCYGGAGPNSFGNGASNGPVIDAEHDLLKALELWVEQGVAPEKIIATKYLNDDPLQGVAFQRPLCPYPKIAKYDGQGNTTDPASFRCVADKDRRSPIGRVGRESRPDRQRADRHGDVRKNPSVYRWKSSTRSAPAS
jgi:feruloyl esterase